MVDTYSKTRSTIPVSFSVPGTGVLSSVHTCIHSMVYLCSIDLRPVDYT